MLEKGLYPGKKTRDKVGDVSICEGVDLRLFPKRQFEGHGLHEGENALVDGVDLIAI
jgi:hypothetical protein